MTNLNKTIHILRNPYGWSEDDVRQARLAAADALDHPHSTNSTMSSDMTDKELLELAAKAAGIELVESSDAWRYPDAIRLRNVSYGSDPIWNPLADDGDALRLAVKLGLLVHGNAAPSTVFCQVGTCPDAFLEKANPDPYAATRRAIVRAAAEIGKEQ